MSVPSYHVCPHLLCLSPPSMSVPTYHVCPLLLCLSQSIMSVPTYYVCPHLSCLSPPIMSVPTYHVCPLLICLSPPIMSVPTDYFVLVCPQPSFLCWQALFKSWVWHFQLSLFFLDLINLRLGFFVIQTFCSAWDQSWTLNLPYTPPPPPPPLPTTGTFRPLPGILGGWDYVDLTHKY